MELVADFTWKSYATLQMTLCIFCALLHNWPPDIVLLTATVSFRWMNIINEEEAWSGFQSDSILAIGVLFVVAKSLEEAGTIETLVRSVLGTSKNVSYAVLRLCVPLVLVSGFINDTPTVAMMLPVVERWAQRLGQPVSKFMIPLSFSALLGGTCTLIGTSTNLVLQGLIDKDIRDGNDPGFELEFFTMTPVAGAVALVSVAYMVLAAPCLLPNTSVATARTEEKRQYFIECIVQRDSGSQTVTDMGLCNITGATLHSIKRAQGPTHSVAVHRAEPPVAQRSQSMPATLANVAVGLPATDIQGTETLQLGDIVCFCCTADSVPIVRKLERFMAMPRSPLSYSLGAQRRRRCLVEVVLAPGCPLIGQSVEKADSISLYGAAIFALKPRQPMTHRFSSALLCHACRCVVMYSPSLSEVWPVLQLRHFVLAEL